MSEQSVTEPRYYAAVASLDRLKSLLESAAEPFFSEIEGIFPSRFLPFVRNVQYRDLVYFQLAQLYFIRRETSDSSTMRIEAAEMRAIVCGMALWFMDQPTNRLDIEMELERRGLWTAAKSLPTEGEVAMLTTEFRKQWS